MHRSIKSLTDEELRRYVERMSDDYRAVMTQDEYFDRQTGVYAVIQEKGRGPETRKEIQMNSGVNSQRRHTRYDLGREIRAWGEEHGYRPAGRGELHDDGPFRKEPGRVGPDGELKVLKHHAEMKVLAWAEAHGYEIVAMAPTRACCPNCQSALKAALGEDRYRAVIPESRQSQKAYSQHLKTWLDSEAALRQDAKVAGLSELPGGGGVHGDGKSAVLPRNPAERLAPAAGKLLSHLGNAATALDALNTAAEAGALMRAGKRAQAARKVLEFGGRTWGAVEGAAIGAELGAVGGSIVPGPGTAIGAAAGGVIGSIVGATYGEDAARKLLDEMRRMGPGGKGTAAGGLHTDSHARALDAGHGEGAALALQRYVYEGSAVSIGEALKGLKRGQAGNVANVFDLLKTHMGDLFTLLTDDDSHRRGVEATRPRAMRETIVDSILTAEDTARGTSDGRAPARDAVVGAILNPDRAAALPVLQGGLDDPAVAAEQVVQAILQPESRKRDGGHERKPSPENSPFDWPVVTRV